MQTAKLPKKLLLTKSQVKPLGFESAHAMALTERCIAPTVVTGRGECCPDSYKQCTSSGCRWGF